MRGERIESAWSEPGLGSFPIAFFILYRLVFLSYGTWDPSFLNLFTLLA